MCEHGRIHTPHISQHLYGFPAILLSYIYAPYRKATKFHPLKDMIIVLFYYLLLFFLIFIHRMMMPIIRTTFFLTFWSIQTFTQKIFEIFRLCVFWFLRAQGRHAPNKFLVTYFVPSNTNLCTKSLEQLRFKICLSP